MHELEISSFTEFVRRPIQAELEESQKIVERNELEIARLQQIVEQKKRELLRTRAEAERKQEEVVRLEREKAKAQLTLVNRQHQERLSNKEKHFNQILLKKEREFAAKLAEARSDGWRPVTCEVATQAPEIASQEAAERPANSTRLQASAGLLDEAMKHFIAEEVRRGIAQAASLSPSVRSPSGSTSTASATSLIRPTRTSSQKRGAVSPANSQEAAKAKVQRQEGSDSDTDDSPATTPKSQ